ncbi:MAG TPA: hypothetical protein PLV32_08510 [Chitinophagaceae bacterium]|nr:hypothetical protein [Chitinophagaceae bacterium]
MKQLTILFMLAPFLVACNNATEPETKNETAGADSFPPATHNIPATPKDTVPQNIQIDSVIHLSFAPGTYSISVKGHLDKRGDPVICLLPIVGGKNLTASVVPENKNATIRFSHIYLPDGTSDGPFGPTLKYKLQQQGLYKLYINANKMAGDPASTDFILAVNVE